jgi:hypothetical protein
VRPGERSARLGLGHRPTVTGLTLKYSFGLLAGGTLLARARRVPAP